MVYQRSGPPREALEAYRQALQWRPDWPPTYLQLGYALRDCGLAAEAIAAWEHALRLDPGNAAARELLARANEAKGR
jgi:cytochrome c-type biogenesis protein CcmH/NrfG